MAEEKVIVDEERPRRRNDVPVGGIFLLFIGTVLLLQTLDVLPWALWDTLWRFWPALLIITGLRILLRRYNAWLVSLLLLAILFACLAVAAWQQDKPIPPGSNAGAYSMPSKSSILV